MTSAPPRGLERVLGFIERAGNRLPNPATLFFLFAAAVVGISAVAERVNLSAVHPVSGDTISAISLLNVRGLHRILTTTVSNFTGFAPLGTVLVAMLGIAVAEGAGLVSAALRVVLIRRPPWLLTASVILAGLLAHVGGDVGFVLVIPLAGVAFQAAGRSPLAGLAAAFAGVSGGFSANVLIGTLDPLLAGLTESAARIIDPTYSVNALCNYYFMASSALLIVAVGTWVTERITLPRFPAPSGAVEAEGKLSASERRGLKAAALALLAFGAILLAGTLPADGFLRDPNTGSLIQSPLISGIVTVIFAGGVIAGLAYGVAAGTIKNDEEVVGAMSRAMATMGPYLVMAFFASQFIAYFNATNLGLIAAIRGAALLKASGLGGMSVMLLLIALSAGINILIASSSAKWAIMAPVFVPMLMLLGHSPELVQATYRIGDSFANVVTPLMPYFPLIVSYYRKYAPEAGVGTVIASMVPYSVGFAVVWTVWLLIWMALGLPLGPGAGLGYAG
jgi:aminobenzoyl-glutamate transport protein